MTPELASRAESSSGTVPCFSAIPTTKQTAREVPWEYSSSSSGYDEDPDESSSSSNTGRSLPMWRRRLLRRGRDEQQLPLGKRTRSYTTGDVGVMKKNSDHLGCKRREVEWRRSKNPTPPPFMLQASFSSVADEASSNPEWWETPEPKGSQQDTDTQSSTDCSNRGTNSSPLLVQQTVQTPPPIPLTSILFHSFLDVVFLVLATAFAVLETSVVWLVHNNRLLRWTGQSVVYVAAHAVRCAGYAPSKPAAPRKRSPPPKAHQQRQARPPLRWRLRRTSEQEKKENALRRKRLLRSDI